MADKWKRKVRALIRLAEDQKGKPEGDLAREKLLQILNEHSEAREYQPVINFAVREVTGADVRIMRKHGITLEGHWEGPYAFEQMIMDYRRRAAYARMLEAMRADVAQIGQILQIEGPAV